MPTTGELQMNKWENDVRGQGRSYRVGIQSSVGWSAGSTCQDRQENPAKAGYWVTGNSLTSEPRPRAGFRSSRA